MHHEKLERMYLAAPVNQALQDLTITIGEGTATITHVATPNLHHGGAAVHGSFLFKLLDDAAYFASSSLITDNFALTASFHVEFFRPVAAGLLCAEGRVHKPGRTLMFASAEVYDEDGRLVAKGTGTFARSPIALQSVPTYR